MRFERSDEHSPDREISVLSPVGEAVAEVMPLDSTDGMLTLDTQGDSVMDLCGCWQLSIVDRAGRRIQTHLLCATSDASSCDDAELTPGLAALATLTLLWAIAPERRLRG